MPDAFNRALSLALEHTSPARAPRSFGPGCAGGELFSLLTEIGEGARLQTGRFLWDMYRGDQLRYLPRLGADSHADFARRPHRHFLNLTRVLVDILSQLYRRPVERTFEGDARAAERIRRAYARNPLDLLLLTCDRLARLQGVCALGVTYESGELRLWPWPAHRLLVVPDPAMPVRPLAVVALAAGEGDLAHVWTPERACTVSSGRVIRETEHGLGRVPFAFAHDRTPVDGFWVEGRGHSIAPANAEFNAKLTEMAQTVSLQGFGVMEVVNPDPAHPLVISPARAIQFSVSGDTPYGVNFKAPNAPIAGLIADLEFHLRTLLKSQRIPESALSVHATTDASGLSILAQQTPVMEDRIERQQLFRAFEADLLECCLATLREHEGLGGRCEQRVNYPEPELEQSASERRARDEWRLKHGMTTPWQLMREQDPDGYVTDDEAKAAWSANVREMQASGVRPQPSATATVPSLLDSAPT